MVCRLILRTASLKTDERSTSAYWSGTQCQHCSMSPIDPNQWQFTASIHWNGNAQLLSWTTVTTLMFTLPLLQRFHNPHTASDRVYCKSERMVIQLTAAE